MPFFSKKTTVFAPAAVLLTAVTISTGCSDSSSETSESPKNVTATYDTRGEITSLPNPDNPTSGLFIRHEAIPDFVDYSGKVTGMNTMTMPFPTADGLELGNYSVGDKVEVRFEVFEQGGINGYAATQLTPLPADAELDFSRLPGADHGHEGHDHHGHDHEGHQH